jgi:hypothetical protein
MISKEIPDGDMNEKGQSYVYYNEELGGLPINNDAKSPSSYLYKRLLPALITLVATLLLFRSFFVCNHHYDAGVPIVRTGGQKVELEAYGMSRCPDFRDCLQQLVVPTMVEVSDKVNFTLSFIGL